MNTVTLKKNFSFHSFMFETSQDLEYYYGYFLNALLILEHQIIINLLIQIYDVSFDENKKITKKFGRLVARFVVHGLGELESISFRDDYVYIGFNAFGFHFYKFKYDKFDKEIKKN